MRTIKFRGKTTKDKVWVYGGYEADESGTYINERRVDPNSVGQYIGINDRNGVQIFEGDIIEDDFNGRRYEVVYVAMFAFCGWRLRTVEDYGAKEFYAFDEMTGGKEVVGNVYTNPEMIKRVKP